MEAGAKELLRLIERPPAPRVTPPAYSKPTRRPN